MWRRYICGKTETFGNKKLFDKFVKWIILGCLLVSVTKENNKSLFKEFA